MRRHWRIVVGVVLALLVVGGCSYMAAGVLVYDAVSAVKPNCGQDDTNPQGRFTAITPANLDYAPTDLANETLGTPFLATVNLASYDMPGYQDVTFSSHQPAGSQPIAISAWWVPADGASSTGAPAVVFVHGRRSCKKDWNVLIPAAMLHRAGLGVLLIDLRNQGSSTITDKRYYGGLVEDQDVEGGIDWLESQRGVAPGHIGLFGASLGAASVIFAAEHDQDVAAVWSDSSYADTRKRVEEELVQDHYPKELSYAGGLIAKVVGGHDIYAESPLTAMAGLTGRQLFIAHGGDDQTTYVHHAHDLYDAAVADGVKVQLWIVPGAGHTRELLVQPGEYEQRMDAFFEQSLGGSSR